MLTFHVNIYARPSGLARALDSAGALQWTDAQRVFDAFLSVSFETAVAALASLPRVDVEPDGFFIFSGEGDEGPWHVSGHLFDFGDRLHRVALHGQCPAAELDALLKCFALNDAELVFELVRQGVVLDRRGFYLAC